MRYLRAICRFVLGIVFILSGFLKAMDPVGNSLKIDEYLKAFHLGFLDFISMPAGILLSCAEFVIGVCILKGIKMKLFSKVALVFVSFFTLLTLYSALFSPVQDCGCFGEALHLTNWETFFKNIVLLVCAVVVYRQRNGFLPIASQRWKYVYICSYTALILGISVYALAYLPQIDFGVYQAGTNLTSLPQAQPEHEYEMVFTYSKDGKEQTFTLENLPDSTWTFVSSDTKLVSASSYSGADAGLILRNRDGVYVTDEVLGSQRPLFVLSVYKNRNMGEKMLARICRVRDSLLQAGADFYILSGISPEDIDSMLGADTDAPVLYTDYKSALSLNRSNGGLTYIADGAVVCKWSRHELPEEFGKLLDEDHEVITANVVIKEQLFAQMSLFVILVLILVVRFFSKIIFNRSCNKKDIKKGE